LPSLTAAVVGTGFIGPVHLEALRRLGRPVAGVLGSSPEKSQQAAERWGLARGYANFADLLADPAVQVVHLASPNRLHFEQCQQAIAAGKHVVCEKPLAMTAAETAQLVALADKAPVVTAVCYNVRFYPLCLEARERIAGGQLGSVYHVTGSYAQDWLLHDTDFNWRVLADEGGALRAVADIGTHWLDLVTSITGLKVARLCADLRTFLPVRWKPGGSVETFQSKLGEPLPAQPVNIDTEDFGAVLLEFDNGGRGAFHVSQVTAGRKNSIRFEIAGARAALAWDSERPNELWQGRRGEANELLVRDPALVQPAVRQFTNYPGGHNEGFPDTFKQLFRAIYDYIERGDVKAARPFPTFAEGHREVVLCEAILRSHREQCWVEVG